MTSLLQYYRKKRFKRAKDKWFRDLGDTTLRLDYPLNKDSVVFDVGGYQGDFAEAISSRVPSTIHVFEPVERYIELLQKRFMDRPHIHIHPFGLGAKSETLTIEIANEGSSLIQKSENGVVESCQIVSFIDFVKNENIKSIDLLKINIEGAEFDLLEAILKTDWVGKIQHLQIQFHSFAPEAHSRRRHIRKMLSKTHQLSYDYYFIWESWVLK